MRFLLDTNAVIALMSNKPPQIRERLRGMASDDAGLSTIVLHELVWGAHKSARVEENLERLTRLHLPLLDFDEADAREAGRIRADLHRKGTPIGPYDLLMALIPLRHVNMCGT